MDCFVDCIYFMPNKFDACLKNKTCFRMINLHIQSSRSNFQELELNWFRKRIQNK